jgi:hypothetical protein
VVVMIPLRLNVVVLVTYQRHALVQLLLNLQSVVQLRIVTKVVVVTVMKILIYVDMTTLVTVMVIELGMV